MYTQKIFLHVVLEVIQKRDFLVESGRRGCSRVGVPIHDALVRPTCIFHVFEIAGEKRRVIANSLRTLTFDLWLE